jgi:hypothetical protein
MEMLSTSSPTAPPAAARLKIEMVFRLWSRDGSFDSPENNSFIQYPGILALIEDVATAQRATVVAAGEQLSLAGLTRPADALLVSRQIQLGLQGFRSKNVAQPIGLSIAINSCRPLSDGGTTAAEDEDRETQPSHDLVTLLKIAKPAQVLVAHDLSEQIENYKGLPLRSFPGRFGVSEYLWTSPERLDVLQSESQLTLAMVPGLPKKPVSAPEPVVAVPEPAAVEEGSALFPTLGSAEKPEPNWRTSFGDPKKAAAIAAAVLVFSLGLWGMYSAFRSAMKVPAPASLASSPVPTSTPSQGPLTTGTVSSTRSPARAPHTTPALPGSKSSTSPVRPISAQPGTADVRKHGCDLEANEVSWYLQKAEEARQQGQYPRAIFLYQKFIACQPNNPEAVAGLAKAKAALGQ